MDVGVGVAGLITGLMVGLTGMGGGALTMPLLTMVFGVAPLAAVSTDLVASAVTKPVGAAVHLRRRTVNVRLAAWLCAGSVPSAIAGAVLAHLLPDEQVQHIVRMFVGLAVLLAAATLFLRMYLDLSRVTRYRSHGDVRASQAVALGAAAGLIVGVTSVGSGSIIIVCLLLLQRHMTSAGLVGTDLVQAVPMVVAAAAAHICAGGVPWTLVASLLAGSIPGVLVGAWLSVRTPDRPVRVVLGGMLIATGLMMLHSGVVVASASAAVAVIAAFVCLEAYRLCSPVAEEARASATARYEGEKP